MIHVFYGKDTFRAHQALDALIAELDTDGMLADNTTRIAGASVQPQDLLALCQTVPFLAANRLIIVEGLLARYQPAPRGARRPASGRRRPPQDLGDWEKFIAELPSLPDTTALVFLESDLHASNRFLVAMPKDVKTADFKPLPQGDVAAWINQRATRHGVQLQARAVAALAGLVGNDLWTLDSELRKLATYAAGAPVTEDDVRRLVTLARQPNVFAMADAVVEGRPKDAAALLQRLLDDGEPPQYLLAMIARQYRLLLLTKELQARRVPPTQIANRLGVQSFAMQRLVQQAPGQTIDSLRRAYRRLLDADLSIKRGIFDDETALQLLAVELASGARAPSPAGRRGYSRPPGARGPSRPGAAKA